MQLYNGDCLEVMKNIADKSVDLIVTDPPYLVTARGSAGNSGGMLQKDINKKGKVFKNNNINIYDYAPEFYRVLENGSHCYVMTNHKNLIEMLNTFEQNGFHFIKSLIWDKGNKIMGQYYIPDMRTEKVNEIETLFVSTGGFLQRRGYPVHKAMKPLRLGAPTVVLSGKTKKANCIV